MTCVAYLSTSCLETVNLCNSLTPAKRDVINIASRQANVRLATHFYSRFRARQGTDRQTDDGRHQSFMPPRRGGGIPTRPTLLRFQFREIERFTSPCS